MIGAIESTGFVGRAGALAQVEKALAEHRLVTLVGADGVGKSRLAKEVLRQRTIDHDRIVSVGLSCERSALGMEAAVAHALGLSDLSAGSLQSIGRGIILLDDVPDWAGPVISAWIDRSVDLRFLVTTRLPLNIAAELVILLKPLRTGEAMALFESRARLVCFDFVITHHNRVLVEQIVERLHRLPLAIELAAARLGSLSLGALASRLERRFELLTMTDDEAASGLTDTIAWAWQMLAPWERALLSGCASLPGPFTADAAFELDQPEPNRPEPEVVLASLTEKGLLRTSTPRGFPTDVTYDIHPCVRQFAKMRGTATSPAAIVRATPHLARTWIEEGDLERAARRLMDAVRLGETLDLRGPTGANRLLLGIVCHLRGELELARACLVRAIWDLEAARDLRHMALAWAHHAALIAELGHLDRADNAFEDARRTLLVLSDVRFVAAVELLNVSVDVARLDMEAVQSRLTIERSIRSPEARIAEMVVKRALSAARRSLSRVVQRPSA